MGPNSGKKWVHFKPEVANRHSTGMLKNLTEPQLSELFVWLVKEYPYASERVSSGTGFDGPEDSASDFKTQVYHPNRVKHCNHMISVFFS